MWDSRPAPRTRCCARCRTSGRKSSSLDIDAQNAQRAISTIELIQANTTDIAIFAVGEMSHPPTIVAAMRAGAGEFLERSATSEALIEALTRFTASRGKGRTSSGRARIFTVMNSKGGAGGTSVAVNTAIALQETQGGVLLVDFAPWDTALFISTCGPRSEWSMPCKICTAWMLRCWKV